MNNVVSFSGFKNAQRAADQQAARDKTAADRLEKERREIAAALGGTVGAQIIADVVTDLQAKAADARPMPAYCDPANESRGAKYEATRNLSPREITARIRADLKEAQKRGDLPADAAFSVRLDTYSGGWAVRLRVTAIPADMRITSEPYAAWVKQFGDFKLAPMAHRDQRGEALGAFMDKVEAIRSAYNRDNSDSMTDYFDVRYYGSSGLDWDLERDRKAAEIAAAPSDYWSEAH